MTNRSRLDRQEEKLAFLLLLALAFAAGCTDAVTYLVMGPVFTANMTGNTVLLGIALITAAGTRAARSACALGGFCVGALLAARSSAGAQGRLWPVSSTRVLLGEVLVLSVLGASAAVVGVGHGHVFWLIGLSGVAMGAQSAAVRAVGVPGVGTTYITGTLTGLLTNAAARRDRSLQQRDARGELGLPAAIWVTYLAAALTGAAASRVCGAQAIWIAVLAVAGVTAVAFANRRALALAPARES